MKLILTDQEALTLLEVTETQLVLSTQDLESQVKVMGFSDPPEPGMVKLVKATKKRVLHLKIIVGQLSQWEHSFPIYGGVGK